MTLILLVKMLTTAGVVMGVTLAVARLGPAVGGLIAGTPIILAPAFFFLGQEQASAFVAQAATAALHALTASLVFLLVYVVTANRLGALSSVASAVLAWIVAASVFSMIPGGYLLALAVYGLVFCLAWAIRLWLVLPHARVQAPPRWSDLLVRGIAAGILVAVATSVASAAGPHVSGTLSGFPVGFTVIALTLHQRFGAPVARATLAAAQSGMLSLIAFAATEAAVVEWVGGLRGFALALAASLGTSTALVVLNQYAARRCLAPE